MSAGRRVLRLGLLLALLAVAVAVYFYRSSSTPRGRPRGEDVTVYFPFGTSTADIFRRLDAEGVVRPAWLAEIYYRLARSATALQAGEYRFVRPTPLSDVINRMAPRRRPEAHHRRPRGADGRGDVRALLEPGHQPPGGLPPRARQPAADPSIARGAPDLEGFLFPDTYVVTRSTSARQIVETMLANFRRHFTPEMRDPRPGARAAPARRP